MFSRMCEFHLKITGHIMGLLYRTHIRMYILHTHVYIDCYMQINASLFLRCSFKTKFGVTEC